MLVDLIVQFSPLGSWEFVTNLEYDYAIITGKRKLTRAFPARSPST